MRCRIWQISKISIHAPRVGSDGYDYNVDSDKIFQSTLPVWGATLPLCPATKDRAISIHAPRVGSDDDASFTGFVEGISIHAPRVGSDSVPLMLSTPLLNFNPRSPCGERQ